MRLKLADFFSFVALIAISNVSVSGTDDYEWPPYYDEEGPFTEDVEQTTSSPSDEPPSDAASLAFVFDTTGSMYDDLVQVIEGAAKILATTLAMKDKPLFNYILVPFHDPGSQKLHQLLII